MTRSSSAVESLEPRQLMSGVPLITVDATGGAHNAAVAVRPAGGYVVAWTDTSGVDGSGYGVLARIYDASGNAAGPAFVVNHTTSGDQDDPGVAVDPAGDIAITWTNQVDHNIYARLFTSTGTSISPNDVLIAAEHVYGGGSGQASITTNSDGTFELGWAIDPNDAPSFAYLDVQQYSDSLVAMNSATVSNTTNNYSQRAFFGLGTGLHTGASGAAQTATQQYNTSVSGSQITVTRSQGAASISTVITSLSTPTGFVPIAVNTNGAAALAWIDSATGDVELQPMPNPVTNVTANSIVAATFRTVDANSVQWTVTFSQPIALLSASDFQLVSSGLTQSPQILSVNAVSPTTGFSDTWTVTANTGAGAGVLGLNLVNSTGIFDGYSITNTLAGQVYSFNSTPTSSTTFSQVGISEIAYGTATDTLVGSLAGSTVAPTGSITATLGGTLRSGTIDADGAFSIPFNTAPLAPGAYAMTISYGGDGISTATSSTLTLIVDPASVLFTNLAGPTTTVNAAATVLGGAIGGETTGLQPGGEVAITLDGVTQLAAIGSDGTFSSSFDTSAVPVGTYPVIYSYSGDPHFNADSSTTTMSVSYATAAQTSATKAATKRATRATFVVKVNDSLGKNLASPKLGLAVVGISSAGGAMTSIKSKFHRVGKTYVLSIKLPKTLARGSYTVDYTVGNDATVRSIDFVI